MRISAVLAILASTMALAVATAGANDEIPPPAVSAVEIPPGQIDGAVSQLNRIAAETISRSGIPGMAIAVVHRDRVLYAEGFGVRKVGAPAPVDPNTVFQLASVSKPIGASVVARLAGQKRSFDWTDPVREHLPWFRLADPWVSRNVTVEDLYSHRSGLPDHAGDLLEDLGYSQGQVLRRLRYYDLAPFRATYAYTNFGLTAAAVAAARSAKTTWPKLSRRLLYRPLGMSSTSSRYADYRRAENKAEIHVRRHGRWRALYRRNADAQSPAGGVSSSVSDLAKWMQMILANGQAGPRQILTPAQILNLRTPRINSSPPPTSTSRSGFYALGMNVSDDSTGRVRLSHSGAFALGAGTAMTMVPAERLGIVVLTNGVPLGAAEAVSATFLDLAITGRIERDWYSAYNAMIAPLLDETGRLAERRRPARPRPHRPLRQYTGVYRNALYGPTRIVARNRRLFLRIGPGPLTRELTHWNGNTFSFRPVGENATGISAIDFRLPNRGRYRAIMRIENLDNEGMGIFRLRR